MVKRGKSSVLAMLSDYSSMADLQQDRVMRFGSATGGTLGYVAVTWLQGE